MKTKYEYGDGFPHIVPNTTTKRATREVCDWINAQVAHVATRTPDRSEQCVLLGKLMRYVISHEPDWHEGQMAKKDALRTINNMMIMMLENTEIKITDLTLAPKK